LQEALENQNEIYAEMLHMQSGGVIVTDMDNRIIICNEAASDIFDMPLNIMMNDIFPDVVEDCLKDSSKLIRDKIKRLKEQGDEISYEYPVDHLDRRVTYIKADSKLTVLSNRNSVIITSLADITSNKEMEQKLVILSETDSLTGLLNRDSGQKRIEQFIKKDVDGVFCIIDVNDFKHINDSFGHPVGDKVLISIAGCLKRAFRRKDILARIGGDEFAVFGADISDLKVGIKCLERLFEFINEISIDGIDDLKVSVSVGAILCSSSEEARSYEEIYKLADTAMYTCKGSGTNKYSFYETE
jgi:diguanylate cyclase (GGDEF)-like protein